jgi:hypothetical protein
MDDLVVGSKYAETSRKDGIMKEPSGCSGRLRVSTNQASDTGKTRPWYNFAVFDQISVQL